MPAERYWLWIDEQAAGPFTIAQFGRVPALTKDTLYWSERHSGWHPVNHLPALEWSDDAERIESCERAGIEWVEYLNAQNGEDCPLCVSMNGRRFRADEAPQMPLEGCTCTPWPISVWIAVEGPSAVM